MPRNQSGRRMFSMNAKIICTREEYGVLDYCYWWKIRQVWFLSQGELLCRSSLERRVRQREGRGQEAAAPARARLLRKVPKCRESLEWNARLRWWLADGREGCAISRGRSQEKMRTYEWWRKRMYKETEHFSNPWLPLNILSAVH